MVGRERAAGRKSCRRPSQPCHAHRTRVHPKQGAVPPLPGCPGSSPTQRPGGLLQCSTSDSSLSRCLWCQCWCLWLPNWCQTSRVRDAAGAEQLSTVQRVMARESFHATEGSAQGLTCTSSLAEIGHPAAVVALKSAPCEHRVLLE